MYNAMDNDEDVRLLVEEVFDQFDFHRYVNGFNIHAALAAIRDKAEDIVELTIARATIVEHIIGVNVGNEFIYRAEMYLVGLHDDLICGISLDIHPEVELATCAVAVYHLHNNFLDEDFVIYGGEIRRLNQENHLTVRVLANQQWLRRNLIYL
jgi:hypothetical protein